MPAPEPVIAPSWIAPDTDVTEVVAVAVLSNPPQVIVPVVATVIADATDPEIVHAPVEENDWVSALSVIDPRVRVRVATDTLPVATVYVLLEPLLMVRAPE